MIRGRQFSTIAVRRPNGEICSLTSPVHSFYVSILRRIPFVRGVVVLLETLVLGTRALTYSANVALEQEGKKLGGWSLGLMLTLSLSFGIGLFFVAPLYLVHILDPYFGSSLLSNLAEGTIRLAFFVGYIWILGWMPDIRRVFAYHGAEHMTVHTYEKGEPLEVEAVRKHPTAHPRCGTAFLLVVLIVAIIIFVFLGRPDWLLRVTSRIVLIPVIAGISYELIRFSGAHAHNILVRTLMAPSLALQTFTTRNPDDSQIEVAIHAMKTAVAADEGALTPQGGEEARKSFDSPQEELKGA